MHSSVFTVGVPVSPVLFRVQTRAINACEMFASALLEVVFSFVIRSDCNVLVPPPGGLPPGRPSWSVVGRVGPLL